MMNPIIEDSGKQGPVVLITAGVHGDEYEPILAAFQLPDLVKGKLLKGKLVVIPQVNSTAVKANTRCGSDGLDLARICPGDPGGSPSMQDASMVSEFIRSADYLIDLHTGGKIFDIHPLAGYMIHPNETVLNQQRDMAKAFGLPVVWGTDYRPDGRTLSVARDAGIPAIYVEYGGGLTARKEIIKAYTSGCLSVLAHLGLLEQDAYFDNKLEYWVEDPTPQMGHLQSKMPAPCDGVFVTSLPLGTRIAQGDLWGEVMDLENGRSTPVYADQTGLLLFLRTQSFVVKGDSLGGVMRVNEETDKLLK